MSLKAFHLVFIVASIGLAMLFGGWSVRQYSLNGGVGSLAMAVAAFVCGAVMLVYSRWFLRKLRGVSYL